MMMTMMMLMHALAKRGVDWCCMYVVCHRNAIAMLLYILKNLKLEVYGKWLLDFYRP